MDQDASDPVEHEQIEPKARILSIDAFRGFVMFLMLAEVLHFSKVAAAFPESWFWRLLDTQTSHVAWIGCSLHDLIQPSFSFLVGVALPFSLASRLDRGQTVAALTRHALLRAFILVALGIFLRSVGRPQTNFTFEDTLTQIGLGYFPLFLLCLASARARWTALGVILVGYWLAFALYPSPTPGPEFQTKSVGVPEDWPHLLTGFQAHWNKNMNLASAFDQWFLNLFPRSEKFVYNGGGYATLSFIPTLATMLLGLFAGATLRADDDARHTVYKFLGLGCAGLLLGTVLGAVGVCPVVKRIWTPAWVIYSGGWCFLILALFHASTDLAGHRKWVFPFIVIGANSIAIYCLSHLVDGFILSSLKTHLGQDVFKIFGASYEPLLAGAMVLAIFWLGLHWMYRNKIFIRI